MAEEREQRQATTRMLGELNKLHPDVVKRISDIAKAMAARAFEPRLIEARRVLSDRS